MSPPLDKPKQQAAELNAAGQIWLGSLITDIDAMPPKTEAERERSVLICRLAGALEDMSEMLPSDHPLFEEAMGWKDRPDLAELLDAWEAGRHSVQQTRG